MKQNNENIFIMLWVSGHSEDGNSQVVAVKIQECE